MHLRASNTGADDVRLYLIGGVGTGRNASTLFDIQVFDTGGKMIWRRIRRPISDDPRFDIVIVSTEAEILLRPGAHIDWWEVWNQQTTAGNPIGTGEYTVVGVIPGERGDSLISVPKRLIILR